MYFWTVRLLTRMPSFSSSPLTRSAPQSLLSSAIRLMSTMVAEASRRLVRPVRDFLCQNRRKPARCQRKIVSGLTSKYGVPPGAREGREYNHDAAFKLSDHRPLRAPPKDD